MRKTAFTAGIPQQLLQKMLQQYCGNALLAMHFLQWRAARGGIQSLFCCIAPYNLGLPKR
jgi:hypothetical protein